MSVQVFDHSFMYYLRKARAGTLKPNDFRWFIRNQNDVALIVMYLKEGRSLPVAFNKYSTIVNEASGWTVAHYVALYSTLPIDFKYWDLRTASGLSVAHVYAMHHELLEEFPYWDLVEITGLTVRDLYERKANHA